MKVLVRYQISIRCLSHVMEPREEEEDWRQQPGAGRFPSEARRGPAEYGYEGAVQSQRMAPQVYSPNFQSSAQQSSMHVGFSPYEGDVSTARWGTPVIHSASYAPPFNTTFNASQSGDSLSAAMLGGVLSSPFNPIVNAPSGFSPKASFLERAQQAALQVASRDTHAQSSALSL